MSSQPPTPTATQPVDNFAVVNGARQIVAEAAAHHDCRWLAELERVASGEKRRTLTVRHVMAAVKKLQGDVVLRGSTDGGWIFNVTFTDEGQFVVVDNDGDTFAPRAHSVIDDLRRGIQTDLIPRRESMIGDEVTIRGVTYHV